MESGPVIEISGVRRVFRDFWRRTVAVAPDGLDRVVQPGEVFGLLGPNGSGKSTTVKLLLGLIRPTEGTLRVLGAAPTDVAVKRRIGYLPELTSLHPFLTPRETLRYYAALSGVPAAQARQRADELLEMTRLTAAADRPVGAFSKGMARRVGLAQALIADPELLILDEPTSGLDPIGTREVKDLIVALARGGRTVLTTSHLLADTEDICDRVAILSHGRKVAEGKISDLLARRGEMRFAVEGVGDANEVSRLRSALESAAGRPVRAEPATVRLEEVFLEKVAASNGSAAQIAPFLRRGDK